MPLFEEQNNALVRKRITIYLALGLGLFGFYLLIMRLNWHGSQNLHTIMEVVATILAFFIGVLALARFYSKKTSIFLILGVGFIGAAHLDGYHALVTSSFFEAYFPSPAPSLLPWSWLASRLFLSISFFMSWILWRLEVKHKKDNPVDEKNVYLIAGLTTILFFFFFAFSPLPRAYYPELFFGRPEEFAPALFFLLSLLGYLKKEGWKNEHIEHWIVLSLIVSFVSEAIYMPLSFGLFDLEFDLTHLAKIFSYLLMLTGLIVNLTLLIQEADKSRVLLEEQNKEVKKAKEVAEAALAESERANKMLDKMNQMMTGRELKMQKLKQSLEDHNQEKNEEL